MDIVSAEHAGNRAAAVQNSIRNNFGSALGAWVVLFVATNASGTEDLAVAMVDSLDSRRARVGVAVGADACGELRVVAGRIGVVRHGG